MTRYLVIIEPTATGYSAYSPDLPGCVTTADSRDDVELRMRDAVTAHLEEFRAGGERAPEPSSIATYVEVAA